LAELTFLLLECTPIAAVSLVTSLERRSHFAGTGRLGERKGWEEKCVMQLPRKRNGEVSQLAVVLASLGCLWGVFLLMNVARDAALDQYDPVTYLTRRLAVAGLGMVLSLAMYSLLQFIPTKSLVARFVIVTLLSFPLGLALALGDFAAVFLWHPAGLDLLDIQRSGARHAAIEVISAGLIGWYFIFAAWGAMYLTLTYAADVRRSERRGSQLREQARIAELRMLKGQINPHFMFNMLNSLSALVMRESRGEAETLISEMAAYLRVNLDSEPLDDVSLREECDLQDRYLRLEGRRFPQRLYTHFDLDPDTEDLAVPAMILQPLIENAVRHGVGRTLSPVNVTVRSRIVERQLEIVIEDDAPPSGRLPISEDETGFGLGLKNVAARLVARYDGAAAFDAGEGPQRGYRVRMVIPEVRHV
jgi:two-component system LytT family sensor kinase